MNNYEILEIPKGSDVVVVKAAYKKLVKRYHPDKTGGDEAKTKQFLLIQTAYEELLKGVTRISLETYQTPRERKRGSFRVDGIKKNSNGDYMVEVSLTNITHVMIMDNLGEYTGSKFTINQSKYDGTLTLDASTVKKLDYQITLRFLDSMDYYGEKTYKIKKPMGFFERLINKIL